MFVFVGLFPGPTVNCRRWLGKAKAIRSSTKRRTTIREITFMKAAERLVRNASALPFFQVEDCCNGRQPLLLMEAVLEKSETTGFYAYCELCGIESNPGAPRADSQNY